MARRQPNCSYYQYNARVGIGAGARTVRKRPTTTDAERTDFLALGAREYGANFGFQRLLEVLDRCGVEATVITSGLVAELFTDTTTAIPMFPTSSMRMATGWCPWVM